MCSRVLRLICLFVVLCHVSSNMRMQGDPFAPQGGPYPPGGQQGQGHPYGDQSWDNQPGQGQQQQDPYNQYQQPQQYQPQQQQQDPYQQQQQDPYGQQQQQQQQQDPYGQQQQQQQYQQDPYHQQGPPPSQQGYPGQQGQAPPPYYGQGSPQGQHSQHQGPPQGAPQGNAPSTFGGIFGKAKAMASQAASALTGSVDAVPEGPSGHMGSPQHQQDPYGHPMGGDMYGQQPPSGPSAGFGGPQHRGGPPVQQQGDGTSSRVSTGVSSLFGKVKGFFRDDDGSTRAPEGNRPGGQHANFYGQQPSSQPPSLYEGSGSESQGSTMSTPFGDYPNLWEGEGQHHQSQQGAQNPFDTPPVPYGHQQTPLPSQMSQQQQVQGGPETQQQQYNAPPTAPEAPPTAPPVIAPEPQIILVDNTIVIISNPVEFYRKKEAFKQAGAQSLQVYSDFERVLTKTKLESGSSSSSNSAMTGSCVTPIHTDSDVRTLGSAELLETSDALLQEAQMKLRQVTDDFINSGEMMDDNAFESYTMQCQQIIAGNSGLHIAAIPSITKHSLDKIGFRQGWKRCFQSLHQKNIPTFIFSSGYGDVVTQSLLQGGINDAPQSQQQTQQTALPSQQLPLNMRIISNFFRTAPDGTVRAFSSPIVHEKNKNAKTAANALGFAVPERSNALVLGSHEDDVYMTDGASGIAEQISVGFIEVQDDFVQRLPGFLQAYDAVVLGEGEMIFVSHLIDDILSIPVPPVGQRSSIGEKLGDGLGRARGFFRSFDEFF